MKKHAMLSASGASRWLTCTPSARLEAELYSGTGNEASNIYADEGTLAHELGEWLIKQRGYGINIDKKLDEIMANELYNEEMMAFCEEYADFVIEQVRDAPPNSVLIQEARLNLVEYIPEGFGTVDNCIIGDGWLTVIDLKYGKGVPVDAYENKQLMVYAIGALEEYGMLYDINNIRLIIHQPRIDNNSMYEISKDNLLRWAREVLKPGAIKAYQGVGEIIPGEHCRFCKVRSTCKANATYNLQVAARVFDPVELEDEQVAKIILRADGIRKWLTSIEEHALAEAIKGKKWPGLKVVQGRSNRKYTDELLIAEKLRDAGYSGEQVVNIKLLGITKLSKNVSKLHFKQIVEPHLTKPPGSPTLVTDEDKRPPYNGNEAAARDFAEES